MESFKNHVIICVFMGKKGKVTLSIDSKVYDLFRTYCDDNAIIVSKKVELWMKDEMNSKSDVK